MKIFTRGALVVALLAGGLGLSGCATTIDEGKAADFVRSSFDNRDSVKVREASCPKDVDAKRGETFTCRVTWVDGDTGTVTLHMTSDDGDVRFAQEDVKVDG